MGKTLLIMAAGMGSRFGGLKQIEPVGPNEEFLIDYSVYDAIKAGFTKIVFIVKEENLTVFKQTIGKRIEPHIEVAYVLQKNDNIKEQYKLPESRKKPLGTGHAILCAKEEVTEPFAIINADDFYGRDAYLVASKYLDTIEPYHYAVVGYRIANTLSPNGSSKRGVCKASGHKLEAIIESSVERVEGKIIASPLNGSQPFTVNETAIVSMNMLLFTPDIFTYLEEKLAEFLEINHENLEKCEFLIPDVLQEAITEGEAVVTLLDTSAVWHGVTYKEDKEEVVEAIQKLIASAVYPQQLWEE